MEIQNVFDFKSTAILVSSGEAVDECPFFIVPSTPLISFTYHLYFAGGFAQRISWSYGWLHNLHHTENGAIRRDPLASEKPPQKWLVVKSERFCVIWLHHRAIKRKRKGPMFGQVLHLFASTSQMGSCDLVVLIVSWPYQKTSRDRQGRGQILCS